MGPTDAIWRLRSWSTLVQVMACCLTAPSHYLNRFWLIISKVLWHSYEDIIIRRFEYTNQYSKIRDYIFKTTWRSLRGQWVNHCFSGGLFRWYNQNKTKHKTVCVCHRYSADSLVVNFQGTKSLIMGTTVIFLHKWKPRPSRKYVFASQCTRIACGRVWVRPQITSSIADWFHYMWLSFALVYRPGEIWSIFRLPYSHSRINVLCKNNIHHKCNQIFKFHTLI